MKPLSILEIREGLYYYRYTRLQDRNPKVFFEDEDLFLLNIEANSNDQAESVVEVEKCKVLVIL